MGILSWFRSRWSAEVPDEEGPSLLYRNQEDDPELEEIRRAAAADVAAVEQDDKFFGQGRRSHTDDGGL